MSSAEWDRRYLADERVQAWARTPNRFLLAETAALPPGRALDLACGMGRNAIWLAERGWTVTAVDFSDVAIAHARERAAEHGVELELQVADVVRYEPPAEAYDLVLVFYLQLPTNEMQTVLSRAAAAVAAGGTFLLVGHDLLNLTQGVGGPDNPSVLYTPDDVVEALAGLEIERAERVRRDIEGEPRPAIDCLVRATRPVRP
jgi:SAM-dependent methyltransferase